MMTITEVFTMTSAANIALSGLNDAAQRVANATSNIVNASSIAPLPKIADNYSGFVPQDTVTLSGPAGGVTTTTEPRDPAYVAAYDPNAPQANAQGLVAAPNVDLASEIVNINVAQVNYGADAAVIKIEDKMQKSLLDIIS
jgi:flagellar basal-body rod protein FlgC